MISHIKNHRILTGTFLALLVILVAAGIFVLDTQRLITIESLGLPPRDTPPVPETTLIFVGDIMLSRSVGIKTVQHDDWRWPFLGIGDYLREADITFGNLEGPLSDEGRNVGSIYSFRADPRMVEGLTYAGFDVVSVANNHIGDWTQTAMRDTFDTLAENDIATAGGGFSEQKAHSPRVIEVNDTRFGFLAYTNLGAPYTKAEGEAIGVAWLDEQRMVEDIKNARTQADVVIVSVHMGNEYHEQANESQRRIAHAAVDAGARFFIGHHPHVIQETEYYKDGFIAYSLGNFVFDQDFSRSTMEGLLLRATMRGEEIVNIEPLIIDISAEFQPMLR